MNEVYKQPLPQTNALTDKLKLFTHEREKKKLTN